MISSDFMACFLGDKRFGLPPLVPLTLPVVKVVPSDTLTIDLTDCTLYGLESVKLQDIKYVTRTYPLSSAKILI